MESVLAALQSAARAPVLINTSFNGPGEPIVDSAFDALAAFERLRLDFLVLGDAMLTKAR